MTMLTDALSASSSESAEQFAASIRRQSERNASNSLVDIVRVTTEVFGAPVTIREGSDPEAPDDRYVVLSVIVNDIADGLKKEREWIRQVRAISQVWSAFRLSVKMAE